MGHANSVMNLAFTADGESLVSNAFDNTFIVWNVRRSRQRALFTGHGADVDTVAASSDGATLASGSDDGTVRLWDLRSGQQRAVLTGHRGEVRSIAFSPDGRRLASGSAKGRRILLWDVVAGRQLMEIETDGNVTSLAISPDGRVLASGAEGPTAVFLWDIATGKLQASLAGHESRVVALDFSRDHKLLVSGDAEGTMRVWDLATRQEAGKPMGAGGPVAGLAVSPDGTTVASSAHMSGTVLLQNLRGIKEPVELATRGSPGSNGIAYSPDGTSLAFVAGELGLTTVLWDVANGKPRVTLSNSATVMDIAFTPDGKGLVTGDSAGVVALADVDLEDWPRRACEIANRNLTRNEWIAALGESLPYRAVCPGLPVPGADAVR